MSESGPFDAEKRMRMSLWVVGICGLALAFSCLAFGGIRATVSVVAGAGLALGNLWVMMRVVAALLPHDAAGASGPGRAAWALVAALKMLAFLSAAWILMRYGLVSPLPMLIGLLSLPIGIAIGSLVSDRSGPSGDR